MKRLLFFIAFMTLGTSALIELLVIEPVGRAPVPLPTQQVANVLNMNDVTVHQLMGDRTRWELRARRATYNENTNTGLLEQVRFLVYEAAPGTQAPIAFSGESGAAFLTTQPDNLVLQGAVVLHRGDDLEIRSERIEFDAARQVLTAPGPVRVRTPQGVQEGTALRYDLAGDHLEFASPLFYQ
jgi:LPS export ABC transporter protein LptC